MARLEISNRTKLIINQATSHAREKHPNFPCSWFGKFAVLFEEIFELVKAVVWERSLLRSEEEAADCIAVLARIIEGD